MRRGPDNRKNHGKPTPLGLIWLTHFLSEESDSFLNATLSAKKSGYRARNAHSFQQIGFKNKQRYRVTIAEWLRENGYSETELKIRLLRLLEAKQTVHLKLRGAVLPGSLPEGCRIIATTGTVNVVKGDGENRRAYGDGDTILGIDVPALDVQIKALDLALRVKGLYSAERVEHSGAIVSVTGLSEEDRALMRKAVDVSDFPDATSFSRPPNP
jgi:hypothetical protein